MNHIVLSLGESQATAVAQRCRSHAAFISRLAALDGVTSTVVNGPEDPAAALAALAAAAGLVGDPQQPGDAIRYVPTQRARLRVAAEEDGNWPQSLASRQRKTLRRTPGALFTFPLEEPGPDTTAPLQVFITDWSPSPAACAVAVHPGHPLSDGLTPGHRAAFTGRYCRHPLTGDLLPIWVADWVKPEFGTGAVLVNPGHDAVDLAFGRSVGLPIRFALAPEDYDEDPANWLVPPVVKTGRAIRTGSTDGLEFTEARAAYFRILSERGLAVEHTDIGAGSFPVASFGEDGPVKIDWQAERRTAAHRDEDAGTPVRLSTSPALAAADPRVRGASLAVVAASTTVETDLLALRLMLAEPALGPVPGQAPEVTMVGPVTGATDGVDGPVLDLALLTAAGATESLAVKAPQLEAAQRFLDAHERIAGASPVDGDADPATTKAAAQIKGLLRRQDTKQAFTQLYRLQKTLAKAESVADGTLVIYEALARIVAGLPSRYEEQRLAAAWQQL
ncbi:class I tRNA ligase family protein [Streptomyces ficellus]|uniref:Class I tRNA ligase family protein n=1 Tax=Streptomyces ficellus TaxID=1977088 RepID=A0ABT7Z6F0_9ACTN|nr:class I tRNA ligase family protein [Streptomyces ficellus]MDN3295056.1 class I tRNA ligase family protein [Streptomyces ficellus]